MAPLHGPGQGLKADVIGAAVAADGQEFIGAVDLSLTLEDVVGRLHAAAGGRGVFKGGVDVAVLPGGVGIQEGGHLQTAGGVADDRLVSLVQGPGHGPADDARAAAGAQTVAAHKALGLGQLCFEIVSHIRTPPVHCCAGPCGDSAGPVGQSPRCSAGGGRPFQCPPPRSPGPPGRRPR